MGCDTFSRDPYENQKELCEQSKKDYDKALKELEDYYRENNLDPNVSLENYQNISISKKLKKYLLYGFRELKN